MLGPSGERVPINSHDHRLLPNRTTFRLRAGEVFASRREISAVIRAMTPSTSAFASRLQLAQSLRRQTCAASSSFTGSPQRATRQLRPSENGGVSGMVSAGRVHYCNCRRCAHLISLPWPCRRLRSVRHGAQRRGGRPLFGLGNIPPQSKHVNWSIIAAMVYAVDAYGKMLGIPSAEKAAPSTADSLSGA